MTVTVIRCPAGASKRVSPTFAVVGIDRLPEPGKAMRPVNSTSAGVKGAGGTKKSPPVAVPARVVTETRPDATPSGTVAVSCWGLADVTGATTDPKRTVSIAAVGSKCAPLTVTVIPTVPIAGLKLVIVGRLEPRTAKASALVAEPAGVVTPSRPVVAPAGTFTVSDVGEAESTVAGVPLKVRTLSAGVAEKAVPETVTVVPGGPETGVNPRMDVTEAGRRPIETMLPAASYP